MKRRYERHPLLVVVLPLKCEGDTSLQHIVRRVAMAHMPVRDFTIRFEYRRVQKIKTRNVGFRNVKTGELVEMYAEMERELYYHERSKDEKADPIE